MQSDQTPDAVPACTTKTDYLVQYKATDDKESGKRSRWDGKAMEVDGTRLEQHHNNNNDLKDGEIVQLQWKKKSGSTESLLEILVDSSGDAELEPVSPLRKRKKGIATL